jgi:hypothetical protein
MRSLLAIVLILTLSKLEAAPTINVAVHAFEESSGRRNIPHSEGGRATWEALSWPDYFNTHLNPDIAFRARNNLTLCKAIDFNRYQWTPCMAAAVIHSMEKSVAELGIDVDFKI